MAVYTIGHSTHPRERFVELLRQHGITAVGDVRSQPYSRMNPQFNREPLKAYLGECGIVYVYLGRELGARTADPACYQDGRVQYGRLSRTELFREGLARVCDGMKQHRIALMCAEQEPLECHRTLLVSRQLSALGVAIEHIHADGTLESHEAALARLAEIFHLEDDLFTAGDERFAEAYRRQEERMAYRPKTARPQGAV